MYSVPGVCIPGDTGAGQDHFMFAGSIQILSSLSFGADIKYPEPFGYEGGLDLACGLLPIHFDSSYATAISVAGECLLEGLLCYIMSGSALLVSKLTNYGEGGVEHVYSCGNSDRIESENYIGGSHCEGVELFASIDSRLLNGCVAVVSSIPATGYRGSVRLSNEHGESLVHVQTPLVVYGDDREITQYVTDAYLKLYGDGEFLSGEIKLSEMNMEFSTVKVGLDDDEFTLFVQSSYVSNKERTLKLQGEETEKAFVLREKKRIVLSGGSAKEAVQSLIPGLNWISEDYTIAPVITHDSPLNVAEVVLNAGGMTLAIDGNARYTALKKHNKYVLSAPYPVLSIARKIDSSPYDGVRLTYGGETLIIPESTTGTAGSRIIVKVFGEPDLTAVGGEAELVYRGWIEEVTEDVFIVNGRGNLSYPVFKPITSGLVMSGDIVYSDKQYDKITVSYLIKYDVYSASKETAGEMILCGDGLNKKFLAGGGLRVLEEKNELITSSCTAKRYAESRLIEAAVKEYIEIEHLYSSVISKNMGSLIDTPAGSGFGVMSELRIEGAPVGVVQKTGLLVPVRGA
ncbi:hypothetical protein [Limisalsivibrio acetivorans]|uniref:hypothetical protein n=1 Tax=Limisalsivibrio acetivorans TaxID=1304888 RepID=UPI0003B54260|nr:hypothetical protein [Limisalsivibrio acetivorans]